METSKCIYCLQWKPISEFNCEHVIPQMMGTYEPTSAVLNRYEVCEECNSYFDRFLESPVSLDSLEGLCRVQHLAKPINDNHPLGAKKLCFTGQDGIFKGLRFSAKSDKTFTERIHLEIEDAIGIIKDEEKDEYQYYTIDDLCICTDEIQKRMVSSKQPLVFFGYEEKQVISALASKGFDVERLKTTLQESVQNMTDMKSFSVQIRARIEKTMSRLAAKTIFNFMCYKYGKEYILGHQFDNFRRFIRYDTFDQKISSFFTNGSIAGIDFPNESCHFVSTAWTRIADKIFLCGIISWFENLTYTFAIQSWVTNEINVLPLNKTCIFDNTNRRVMQISDNMLFFDWPDYEGGIAVPKIILGQNGIKNE